MHCSNFIIYNIFSKMDIKRFSQEVKNLFKNNSANAQLIWGGMEGANSEENVAYFCYQIFDHLVAIDKKQGSKWDQEKLLSTLLVLQFYRNKKIKKKAVIEDIKKLIDRPQIRGQNKWVLQIFTNHFQDQEFVKSLISQWTLYPYEKTELEGRKVDPGQLILDNIDFIPINEPLLSKQQKYFVLLKNLSFPQYHFYEPKVLAFSYICFMDYVRDHENSLSQQSYSYLKDAFVAHVHALKDYSINKRYIISTIHLVESVITFYGCPYENILKEFMMWADQLRNCPGFLGEIGHQFFIMIHNQLKSPGYSFRKKLRTDFPSLDMAKSDKLNKQIYLISSSIDDCCSRPQYCSLLTLRKLIIMHILKFSGITSDSLQKYYAIVQSLDKKLTYQLYFRLMKITDISSSLEIYQRIKKVQLESVIEVMSQIAIQFQQYKKQAPIQEVEDFAQIYRDNNSLGIFQYPSYEVINVNIDNFVSKKAQNNFYEIAKKNLEEFPQLNFYQNKIPLVFYGDGFSFSKLLPDFVKYYQNTNFQNSRNLKVYYIPKPEFEYRSGIAVYLAANDIWYKRFVYTPFRQKMLFPHLQLNEKNKYCFPNYLINKSLQMYIREAKRVLPLKIYKCHIYLVPIKNEKNQIIKEQKLMYFCSSILIGSSVEVEIIKVNKQRDKLKQEKYSKIEFIEILLEKIKKIEYNQINIKAQCYDALTKQTKVFEEKNLKVEDLQILNLPRHYFMGKKPDPSNINLQMTILLENYGKIFRKQITNKDIFKKISQAQIIQAFRDLFIIQSVRKIEIERAQGKDPFKMIIDGRVIKDIQKIQVEPAYSQIGLPISVPLMTFLPFNTE